MRYTWFEFPRSPELNERGITKIHEFNDGYVSDGVEASVLETKGIWEEKKERVIIRREELPR